MTALRSGEVLTPNEAAEVLRAPPVPPRLLDHAAIDSETFPSSAHRRLLLADLLAFQAERDRQRAGFEAFRPPSRTNDLADA